MEHVVEILRTAALQTATSLAHNWPYLAVSVLVAAALRVFADTGRLAGFLNRHRGAGVLLATAAAVATPLCSCGTMAVVLGMMANSMPLAPVAAFLIASPLSSPEELFYSAGLFGWPFALAYFSASLALGLAGGWVAGILERKGYLAGQVRLVGPENPRRCAGDAWALDSVSPAKSPVLPARRVRPIPPLALAPLAASACGSSLPGAAALPIAGPCGCGEAGGIARNDRSVPESAGRVAPDRVLALARAAAEVSRKLLPLFLGFAFLGYVLNQLVPVSWVSALFGRGRLHGVPLAATVGLPLYLSSEASLPLVRAFLDAGMGQGAVMAFLIAGAGTSLGAISGALLVVRWRVVGLVVAVLWAGAILAGYGFDALVALGLA